MSEVNALLLCHWLESMGHEISVLVPPEGEPQHFNACQVETADVDVVFIFKSHGLRTAKMEGLLQRSWPRIALWADALNPEKIIGDDVKHISQFAWGTPEILERSASKYPWAQHCLCEHATIYPIKPNIRPAQPKGLYAGRLPKVYLDVLNTAADAVPMEAVVLWIEDHERSQQILLRPSQVTSKGLDRARQLATSVKLWPGVNMISSAKELSAAAFGLVPAALPSGTTQVASACKFYDYLALGLPTVVADNVPESKIVRANPELGVLFKQGDTRDLQSAVTKALLDIDEARREQIQDWVFEYATYQRRAETLHHFLFS